MSVTSRVMSRIYHLPCGDPVEVIADYACAPDDIILAKSHESHTPGLTITAHGCDGGVWLEWDDVPKLIDGLRQAMEDRPS